MATIDDAELEKHLAAVEAEGFEFDPPGFERLSAWTRILMNLSAARANFERLSSIETKLGDIENVSEMEAAFVAGIMAYNRCYASSGKGIPMLDAKEVYKGSEDGIAVHRRLDQLRNKYAAHTEETDVVRTTLAVKDKGERIVVRHLVTMAMPLNEVPDFLEAVAHTEHFAIVAMNKYLNHLQTQMGKEIVLD